MSGLDCWEKSGCNKILVNFINLMMTFMSYYSTSHHPFKPYHIQEKGSQNCFGQYQHKAIRSISLGEEFVKKGRGTCFTL